MKHRELLDDIVDRVSSAQVTSDHEERRRILSEALALACKFVNQLKLKLRGALRTLLDEGEISGDTLGISLRDMAATTEGLEVFGSAESFNEFLDGSEDLLREQARLSRKKILEIFDELRDSYEAIADAKISEIHLDNEIIARLQAFFCRPPFRRGGPLVPDDPAPEPDAEGASVRTIGVLAGLASIGTFIVEIGEKILPFLFSVDEDERPSSAITYPWKVLSILAPLAVVSRIGREFGENLLDPDESPIEEMVEEFERDAVAG